MNNPPPRPEQLSDEQTMTRGPGSPWATRLVILSVIFLVLAPIAIHQFPSEVARWYVAAGQESFLDGNQSAALASIERAIARDPKCVEAYLLLADVSAAANDNEKALAAVEKLVEIQGDSPALKLRRSHLLHALGSHHKAYEVLADIERWDVISDSIWLRLQTVNQRLWASILNARAYARALSRENLADGLREVEQSLEISRSLQTSSLDLWAELDTRGYLFYLLDRPADARRDLDESVELAEEIYRLVQKKSPALTTEPRTEKRNLESYRRSLAVVRYHRSLVYDQLGDKAAAQQDRQRVIELGFEPNAALF